MAITADWTEISNMKAILREYSVLLSPDETKVAVVCLEDGAVISIYDRAKEEVEFVSPQLAEGMNLIRALIPMLKETSGADVVLKRLVIEDLIEKGIKCAHCEVSYLNFEDFVERNPRRGSDPDLFVDSFCWEDYERLRECGNCEAL